MQLSEDKTVQYPALKMQIAHSLHSPHNHGVHCLRVGGGDLRGHIVLCTWEGMSEASGRPSRASLHALPVAAHSPPVAHENSRVPGAQLVTWTCEDGAACSRRVSGKGAWSAKQSEGVVRSANESTHTARLA